MKNIRRPLRTLGPNGKFLVFNLESVLCQTKLPQYKVVFAAKTQAREPSKNCSLVTNFNLFPNIIIYKPDAALCRIKRVLKRRGPGKNSCIKL